MWVPPPSEGHMIQGTCKSATVNPCHATSGSLQCSVVTIVGVCSGDVSGLPMYWQFLAIWGTIIQASSHSLSISSQQRIADPQQLPVPTCRFSTDWVSTGFSSLRKLPCMYIHMSLIATGHPAPVLRNLPCSAATEADEERAPEKEKKRKDSWIHQTLLVSSCYVLFWPSSQLLFSVSHVSGDGVGLPLSLHVCLFWSLFIELLLGQQTDRAQHCNYHDSRGVSA